MGPEGRTPSSIDCRERGSHARSAFLAQDTSRMRTARVKEEEEADTRIIVKEEYKIWKKGTRTRREKTLRQVLISDTVPNKA